MEILLRCVGALEILICWLTAPIYYLLSLRKLRRIPPVRNPILLHSASELARKIRDEEYTSEQVVRAFILRCREVNPMLNAVVEDRYVKALGDAHTVDQLIFSKAKTKEQLAKETPFLGVPFTVKESVGVKGLSQSVGCLPRRGIKAQSDGESVRNLRRAGAIPIAVTNTPELCLCWESTNLITGRTNNPYNPHRTPGGSSGGEAALLGSAASVVGVASDIAGSIRLPAAFTGVFGHKPTPGYVSLQGHFPNSDDGSFEKFLTTGPMVRYVEDLKPIFELMAGEKGNHLKLDEEVDLKKLRIMYNVDLMESMVMIPTDVEIKKVVEDAVTHFQTKYNSHVEKPQIEEFNDAMEISCSVFFQMGGIPDLMTLTDDPKELLGDDGVFILPTHPIPAYHHGQFTMKTAGVGLTMIFNTLEMPATHVPIRLNKQGLPIGLQVVAAPHQDRLCLAVAKELGDKFGGWIPPC